MSSGKSTEFPPLLQAPFHQPEVLKRVNDTRRDLWIGEGFRDLTAAEVLPWMFDEFEHFSALCAQKVNPFKKPENDDPNTVLMAHVIGAIRVEDKTFVLVKFAPTSGQSVEWAVFSKKMLEMIDADIEAPTSEGLADAAQRLIDVNGLESDQPEHVLGALIEAAALIQTLGLHPNARDPEDCLFYAYTLIEQCSRAVLRFPDMRANLLGARGFA